MNFDKVSHRRFRSTHASEESRQELLAKVNSDRAVREVSRRRLKAAVYVQRVYRGWHARRAIRRDCIDHWLHMYSKAAADLSCFVPAVGLSGVLLPPIFQVYKGLAMSNNSGVPPGSHQPGNSPLSGSAAVALRGTFALLLRSVSSTQRELNFCGLAVEEHHR
ncbi:hypothetical protein ABBQ32_010718 [Trebouxia sp. C0010 RCD-2024]